MQGHLEGGVVHQPAREHERVRPDAELRGEVVVQRVEVLVETPADGLGHHQQEDDREGDREPQAEEHAGEHPLEVARAADLSVQGGAPVRPQQEEHQRRDEQHRRAERAEAERRCGVAGLGGRPVGGRVGVVDAEELVRFEVERADEAGVRVDQQQDDHDGEADHAADEAPALDLRVTGHADGDQEAGQRDRDQGHDEDPVVRAEPRVAAAGPGPLERGPQRLEQLNRQDVAVDRRPQPEDEPPAGRGHHEADAAAQDPGLPDVIAAGPRNRDDEPGIGDHQERNPDSPDDHSRYELALREGRPGKGELVDAERHEVGRQARVDQRVPDRPAADQACRLAEEESRSLLAECSCRHYVSLRLSGPLPDWTR